MKLEDKLYTSTEVAEILGVSLRSVYRYLEDGKLFAEVKTATGRHRFTKQNILDFLYPSGASSSEETPKIESKTGPEPKPVEVKEDKPVEKVEEVKEVEEAEEEVDWLAKFREAANNFKEKKDEDEEVEENVESVASLESVEKIEKDPVVEDIGPTPIYYRSMLGGLKEVAQSINTSSKNSNLEYAFTLNAGLSLHKPIKPFAMLHVYIRSSDKEFYEKSLKLTPAEKANAQLCLITVEKDEIFSTREELHGLFVVSKEQLISDADSFGDAVFKEELQSILG